MNNLAEVDGLSRDSPADGLGFRVQGVGCRGFYGSGFRGSSIRTSSKTGTCPAAEVRTESSMQLQISRP